MASPNESRNRTTFGIVLRWLGPSVLFLGARDQRGPGLFQGYIEGEFVYVASPFGGRGECLSVDRGDPRESGAPLFVLDATFERGAREEARRRALPKNTGLRQK